MKKRLLLTAGLRQLFFMIRKVIDKNISESYNFSLAHISHFVRDTMFDDTPGGVDAPFRYGGILCQRQKKNRGYPNDSKQKN